MRGETVNVAAIVGQAVLPTDKCLNVIHRNNVPTPLRRRRLTVSPSSTSPLTLGVTSSLRRFNDRRVQVMLQQEGM